tara:strand:+ start:165253 stop:166119 length:867 start_codon:yes stop_codon:yes gene_type:complete
MSTDRNSRPAQAIDPWAISPAVLTDIQEETTGVRTYHFSIQSAQSQTLETAKPGQFNMVYAPGVGEAALSISGDVTRDDEVVHTIRDVGNVTGELAKLTIGATVGIRGPFGSAWPIDQCVGDDIVLVGGGIGLPPLRPVIYELIRRRHQFGSMYLLVGSRSPSDLLYDHEYSRWQEAGIDVESTVDRAELDWSGNIGVVTQLMDRLNLNRPTETTLMTCGPEVMMMYAIQTAISKGLSRDHIWLSLERNMNCAVGTCGHCQFGPNFLCKDGPVLRFDRIERYLEVADL